VIAALNGVCGDHLAATQNPLALSMQLRVLLPDSSDSAASLPPSQDRPLAGLLELERRSVELHPQPDALNDPHFTAGKKLLVLVHGLCMSEREWTSQQHNHADVLAAEGDYTPIYALYNSGLNISTNGRALNEQLAGVVDAWPTPVESITFIGFSMGGLVIRSAMQHAAGEGSAWLDKVDKAVYMGTPHHGAALERGGFLLQKSMLFSPYTAPLSALGRARSAGITDLRHGNVQDDDWMHHDEHDDNADYRRFTPLPQDIEHYAIAATLSRRPAKKMRRLRSDGLVHPASATGRHRDPYHRLLFPEGNTTVLYDLGHLAMLRDLRVLEQLRGWLG
jgi:pimeloyl-ACP methyl ester carboxylesterase